MPILQRIRFFQIETSVRWWRTFGCVKLPRIIPNYQLELPPKHCAQVILDQTLVPFIGLIHHMSADTAVLSPNHMIAEYPFHLFRKEVSLYQTYSHVLCMVKLPGVSAHSVAGGHCHRSANVVICSIPSVQGVKVWLLYTFAAETWVHDGTAVFTSNILKFRVIQSRFLWPWYERNEMTCLHMKQIPLCKRGYPLSNINMIPLFHAYYL